MFQRITGFSASETNKIHSAAIGILKKMSPSAEKSLPFSTDGDLLSLSTGMESIGCHLVKTRYPSGYRKGIDGVCDHPQTKNH